MEEKLEEVVEETTQETTEQVEEQKPELDLSKFESADDPEVTKVDLSIPPTPIENETKEDNANDSGVVAESENADAPQEQEKVQPESETQETPVVEEIIEEDVIVETTTNKDSVSETTEVKTALPENIEKLVEFMNETGGNMDDYVKLNKNYDEMDNQDILYEYYKQTKPHLNSEEINFLMEDSFSYDEDADDERDIRRKKLAQKEQVASAKSHLDGQKSKYYKDIKMGSKLTSEQQDAIDFFNRYNKEEEANKKIADKQKSDFLNKTENVFNDKFKGFEYNVGDKKFRFNVNNANEVKDTQGDINNFVKKFLNEDGEVSDPNGYHKSLYTAMNADAIAKHFYEQGQSDAMKNSVANAKNIDMSPRQSHSEITTGGIKVRALGDAASDFKFKIKSNKNK